MKEIILNVNTSGYYGCNIVFWTTDTNGTKRKEFIKTFCDYFRNQEWLQKNMNVGEVMDFIQTLSNELNGDELYSNLIENFYYVHDMQKKAGKLDILNQFNQTVHPNLHSYTSSDSISLFSDLYLTSYFQNKEDFKDWFLFKLENENEDLYKILCDDSKSNEQLIAVLKEKIEEAKHSKEYHERYVNQYSQEIKELEINLEKAEENRK